MNRLFLYTIIVFCGVATALYHPLSAQAVTPTFSLSKISNSSAQVNIYGDANSSVRLNYGPSASLTTTLGTTDGYGNLVLPVSVEGYSIRCGNKAYVTINGAQSPMIAWSFEPMSCNPSSNSALTFSQDDVVLNVGQSQTVVMYGATPFTVASNSNASVISTGINGNVLTLSAAAFGGATVRVCDVNNQCNTIDVVAVNNGPQQNNVVTQPLGLASFMIASNNANGKFVHAGNLLTFTFSGNKPLANVSLKVNNNPLSVTGGGAGPYSATYLVTGSEGTLFPVVASFTDTSGTAGQATFALGAFAASVPVASPAPTTPPQNSPQTPSQVSTYTFTSFLKRDMTGTEVTELQKRLTTLGFYSGPVTGTYGPLTEAAVKKLQKAHGITQAGYVGPGTRAILNK